MMGAVSLRGMSVTAYQISRGNNPQYSHFHTRSREDVRTHQATLFAGWRTGFIYQFFNNCKNGKQHLFGKINLQQDTEVWDQSQLYVPPKRR